MGIQFGELYLMKHSEHNLVNVYAKKYLHLKILGIQFGELYLYEAFRKQFNEYLL